MDGTPHPFQSHPPSERRQKLLFFLVSSDLDRATLQDTGRRQGGGSKTGGQTQTHKNKQTDRETERQDSWQTTYLSIVRLNAVDVLME